MDTLIDAAFRLSGLPRTSLARQLADAECALQTLSNQASYLRGEVERQRLEIRELEKKLDEERHECSRTDDERARWKRRADELLAELDRRLGR